MKQFHLSRTTLAVAIAVLSLAACSGGSGGDDGGANSLGPLVEGTDVPRSATSNPGDALTFAREVAAQSNDSAEPLELGELRLATSETDEPDPSI